VGKVYIVGAGPGDPELITIKAMKAIQKADVILYDRLVNKELLAYAKKEADLIYCGKLPNYHTMRQETINKFLVKYAQAGKIVTRLKGGDPYLFGRGGEEAEVLVQKRIPFEVIPGVTAASAASAYAGIPLTHRNISASCAFITGHRAGDLTIKEETIRLMKAADTVAVYMGVKNIAEIQDMIIRSGKNQNTPVAFIEWATTEEQRTVTTTVKEMAKSAEENCISNPCMIIIGEVVRFHDQLNWFEKQMSNIDFTTGVSL